MGRFLRRVLPPRARRLLGRLRRRLAPPGWALTAAAFVLVVGVLLAPDQYGQVGWATVLRVPLEAVVIGAVTLLLPERAARVVALLAGALVGLVGLLKVLDLGFSTTLGRPFDPVNDWSYFGNAKDYLTDLLGGAAGTALFALLGAALVLLVVMMALATGRLVRSMRRRRRTSGAVVLALWAAWAVLGATGVGGAAKGSGPVGAAGILADHAARVPEGRSDRNSFEQDLANDSYADAGLAPGQGDALLAGLRGKDVLLVWVESYGRSAIEKPAIAKGVLPVLQRGQAQLAAKGFSGRSGWLTSPVAGGGSWFAHSTLESGAWITNADRYDKLLGSDRATLNKLFRRAGWRTVAMMPNVVRDWPEGAWYQFDRIYPFDSLGYRGPNFGWSKVPDQYTLEKLYRLELAKKGRPPVMASVELGSSHSPWAPLPQIVDWKTLGDGSFYAEQRRQGPRRDEVWKNSDTLGQGYMRSLQYALQTTFDFVTRYATQDTVVVFLGDHQPIPLVTGAKAGRDVPITVLSADPAVLDRVATWGWQPGLTPDAKAPVWSMNLFRDRFVGTFGPS